MMKFYKYQATGNDFILLDFMPQDPAKVAQKVCDRHFGIGADGLMFAQDSEQANIRMHYYNADGSRAQMCGNGLRCFVRFLLDQDKLQGDHFQIETDAGVIDTHLQGSDIALSLTIDDHAITNQECTQALSKDASVLIDQRTYHIQRLATLHAITQVKDFNQINALGPYITTHPYFPDHINVNFVQRLDNTHLYVRTHERGAGWTLSCGTGVAASALMMHRLGLCAAELRVDVLGGQLKVTIEDTKVILQGPAQWVAEGLFQEDSSCA